MTTQLDGIVVPNSIPARVGRKEKKLLAEIKEEIDESIAALVVASGQATTGTTTTAGEIAIAGMTANGVVIVTAAEDPGVNLVISHVVAASGKITVYTRTVVEAGTTAAAALSGKKVNYIVIAK
jgi:hypothetical protein